MQSMYCMPCTDEAVEEGGKGKEDGTHMMVMMVLVLVMLMIEEEGKEEEPTIP